uniref:Cytochrome P450 n=1 Tax=Salix viminalis TaxID=40686 RepID=A0A6N2LKV9_SALVM
MSAFKVEPILRSLHAKFGPMVTLRVGTRTAIFIADRTLAHEALIQSSAVYADRQPAGATIRVISSNQHNITSSSYGPTWRLLRRNLTAEILHPSRVKSYTHARNWVLQIIQNRFESQAKAGRPICAMEHFQHAMFCLLVLMCFGDKLDEDQIKRIKEVQRQMIVNFNEYVLSMLDTLLDLEIRNEKRKLKEEEMVSLCSEFLDAGTDTTSTALQWIMANLVKYPQTQEKLFMEIKGVVQDSEESIKEEELQR